MSSDIPFARACLKKALKSDDLAFVHGAIRIALKRLDRDKPEFKVKHDCKPVTKEQAAEIKRLRAENKSEREISAITKQNSGRVSEVINGKRKGI
jgi:hypothetical protein